MAVEKSLETNLNSDRAKMKIKRIQDRSREPKREPKKSPTKFMTKRAACGEQLQASHAVMAP